MNKKYYQAVFISPHLDDAVFSCGGTLAQRVGQGSVLVLNLFTRYDQDVNQGMMISTKDRYAEEEDASQCLGYTSASLHEPQTLFRRGLRSPGKLLDRMDSEDFKYVSTLSKKIQDCLDGVEYRFLYVPLGIGWHIDHLMAHLAMEPHFTDSNLFFYEDAPYCLVPHLTGYRLNDLGHIQATASSAFKPSSVRQDWLQSSWYYGHVASIARKPSAYRFAARIGAAMSLFKLLSKHRKVRPNRASVNLTPILNDVTDQFSKKIEAITRYKSQYKIFFASAEDCAIRYQQYSSGFSDSKSGIYERFWQIR